MSTVSTSGAKNPACAILGLIILAALVVFPWFSGPFVLHLAVLTAINIIVVNGLALISRSGQLSLGHAAFMAVGAYVAVILGQRFGLPFFLTSVVGIIASMVVALVLGWIILRLRGVYFVLVTFAFGELVRLVLLDFTDITGGANGITSIAAAEIFGFKFDSRASMYALCAAVALLTTWMLKRLFNRPIGHAIDSVAVNPALAESTGLSVHRLQVFSFVIGCGLAGLGSVLQAHYIGYISPETYNTSISVGLIVMLVIGGRNSVWGPLVGAIVLTPLPELFRGAVQTQHIFYGAALILILRFLPGGLSSLPGVLRKLTGKEAA